MIKNISVDELKQLAGMDGLILQGCGGDPNEWLTGINETLTEEGILQNGGVFKDIYVFEHDGRTNILFDMEGVNLDIGKLAVWRLKSHDTFGGTWLGDYLTNRFNITSDLEESDEEAPPIVALGERPGPYRDGFNSDGPSKDDPVLNSPDSILRVYIEKAGNESIGGCTIPLPVTREALQPWLERMEITNRSQIAVKDVDSSIDGLSSAIMSHTGKGLSLDELNYLAANIQSFDEDNREVFTAVLSAGRHTGSVADMINATENIGHFYLQPAYTAEQYGEYLIDAEKDMSGGIFQRLEDSGDPHDRDFAQYILRLEAHVDYETYGRDAAETESGAFTESGYLTEADGFDEVYRDAHDIPAEYRLSFSDGLSITKEVELTPFLLKLHAVTGTPMRDAGHELETLTALRSSEYLLLLNEQGGYLTEAAHVYRNESDAFKVWMDAPDGSLAFAVHITEVHGRLDGDVVRLEYAERRSEILGHTIEPYQIDAVLKNGDTVSYTPQAWNSMSPVYKDGIESWTRRFDSDKLTGVIHHLEDITAEHQNSCHPVSEETFLADINATYMKQAHFPQPDMLRVSREAAREMLARGDAGVCRLLPDGPEKLSPIDAVKGGGLWYTNYREFAICREDAPALDKWAQRASGDVMRSLERGGQKKSQETEI